jgi:2-methylisocitrate lyase-like PEP mutase family enzyme
MSGKAVIGADEMVDKIHAAVDARHDPGFIIKARTDAAATHGIDEAIRRARLYAKAGADLLFADALTSEDDIRRFTAEVGAPVAVNMGFGLRGRRTTPLIPARKLEMMGVAVVIYPRLLTSAAVHGMRAAMDVFKDVLGQDAPAERTDLQDSFEELNDLMGLGELQDREQRYTSR